MHQVLGIHPTGQRGGDILVSEVPKKEATSNMNQLIVTSKKSSSEISVHVDTTETVSCCKFVSCHMVTNEVI